VLTDAQCLRWNDALQRLLNHEPLAYITGISWFLHLKLQVSPAVLIPRPETEELASLVMKELKHRPDAKILDIGTGSGCIALAIKSTLPTVHMHAVDISQDALDLAGKNAEALKTDISFHCLDICDTMQWKLLPSDLDVIVSNPPYIPLNEKPLMSMSTVLHEPHLALFTGEDALVFYRVIALFGKKHLKAGGIIWVEINEFAGEDTLNIFKEHGYSQVQIAQDINGKDRFISCKNT
jgi:release factor glutamine methyltransferase